jgi:hypothetical protein
LGGALVLSLGGWLSGLAAQEPIWRPVSPPTAVATAGDGPEPVPAAELGRPQGLAPPPFARRSVPVLLPIAFEAAASGPAAPAAPPPAALPATLDAPMGPLEAPMAPLIATSATAPAVVPPEQKDDPSASDFAQERPDGPGRRPTPWARVPPRGWVAATATASSATAPGWPGASSALTPVSAARAVSLPSVTVWRPSPDTASVLQPVVAFEPQLPPAGSVMAPGLPVTDAAPAPAPPPSPSTWTVPQPGINPWTAGPTIDPGAAGHFAASGGGCCPSCGHCYVEAEYLLWWLSGEHTPPLLTTSAPNDFGILGNPTTRVLFGGHDINDGARSGGRFTAGYWLGCDSGAIEVSGFFLDPRNTNTTLSSFQFPVLGRPFFNVNTGAQFSQLIALPGVSLGSGTVNAPSEFWGAEMNLRCKLCCNDCWKLNALVGFRYLDLEESLKVTENIQGLPTAPAPFTNETITVFDRFATHSQFYGGQIGVDGSYTWGRWVAEGRFKLGLGATEQTIDVDGGQRFVAPDGTVSVFKGGLLALPGNIGHFSQARFSVVPELGINLGYQLTPHLRGFVGYNVLVWTNVIRPGDQIDTNLNVGKIPNFPTNSPPSNSNHPLVPFRQTDLWAQGLLLGVEWTF